MADGVVFLPSFHEAIKDLPDAERLQMYDAIIRYGLYGETIELSSIGKSLFCLMKPIVDSSQNRHRAAKENGSKPPKPGANPRGRPPRENQTENQSNNQTENHEIDIDSDYYSDIDSDMETQPPTLEEVKQFAFENGMKADPEQFYNYNAARGWKIGNDRVTDWKALFRSWNKREKPNRQYVTAAEYQAPKKIDVVKLERLKQDMVGWSKNGVQPE